MELHVIGSGSKGNSYFLRSNSGEVLLLEAGVRFDEVKKALDFKIQNVIGCLVTHEHGDHAKYVHEIENAYIPTYMSAGTHISIMESQGDSRMRYVIKPMKMFNVGPFKILPFEVQHDAAQPLGFLINHHECGNVLFATDTYYLKYRFKGLRTIMIECNYRQDILDRNVQAGLVNGATRNRIMKSHMSYATCIKTLLANDLSNVKNIVLIHLSGNNSSCSQFVAGVKEATGKETYYATKGLTIQL